MFFFLRSTRLVVATIRHERPISRLDESKVWTSRHTSPQWRRTSLTNTSVIPFDAQLSLVRPGAILRSR